MPRTLDSIVQSAEKARELKAAGRSPWTYRLNIPLDPAWSFEVRRAEFADAFEASRWFRSVPHEPGDEIWDLWDEIKDADDEAHFNGVLDAIYDLADEDRCWLTLR